MPYVYNIDSELCYTFMSREFSCSFPADKTDCVIDNLPQSNSKVRNL